MNKKITLLAIGLLGVSGSALADYYDYARVIDVSPAYVKTTVTSNACDTYDRPVRDERSLGGAIIGGIAGAAIGSTIGKGHGNTAAKVVGGVTGAIVGDRLDNDRYPTRGYQDCRPVRETRTVQQGYDVTYEYGGKSYVTQMEYPPGDWLKVQVSVTPLR